MTKGLPGFFKVLSSYSGSALIVMTAYLLIIIGLRVGELRGASWDEIDFNKAIWEIPASRMKMRWPHIVPLSEQALSLTGKIRETTGDCPLMLLGCNDPKKIMNEASTDRVSKRTGHTGRVTGHGLWHTMSMILHEQDCNTAWIETQPVHADKNSIRDTYNHAQYPDGRWEMLQWYADCMDSLEHGGDVVHMVLEKHV